MKDCIINFRCDTNTKERFEKLILITNKNKQDLMNDLIDSYLLLNNKEQKSLDKKMNSIIDQLNIISEYVQIPVKCYGKEMPTDFYEINRIVKAKSKYDIAITEKIKTAKLPGKWFLT